MTLSSWTFFFLDLSSRAPLPFGGTTARYARPARSFSAACLFKSSRLESHGQAVKPGRHPKGRHWNVTANAGDVLSGWTSYQSRNDPQCHWLRSLRSSSQRRPLPPRTSEWPTYSRHRKGVQNAPPTNSKGIKVRRSARRPNARMLLQENPSRYSLSAHFVFDCLRAAVLCRCRTVTGHYPCPLAAFARLFTVARTRFLTRLLAHCPLRCRDHAQSRRMGQSLESGFRLPGNRSVSR